MDFGWMIFEEKYGKKGIMDLCKYSKYSFLT
jgi:hypothetical protein